MLRINIGALLVSLSVFAFSVSSYSVRAGIAAYSLLFCSTLFMHRSKIVMPVKFVVVFVVVAAYILTLMIVTGANYPHRFFITMAMISYPLILIILINSGRLTLRDLDFVAAVYVVIHSLIFFTQLSVFIGLDYYIDFNNFVREEFANTAYLSKDMGSSFMPIRPTGIFSEPSFYSMAVAPVAFYLVHRSHQFKWYTLAGLASVTLSFSAAALIVLFLWLNYFITYSKAMGKYSRIFLVLFLVVEVLLGTGFVVARTFDSADYDALAFRLAVFGEITARDLAYNLFGSGFYYNEQGPNGVTGISAPAIRDSGMLVSTFYSGGVVALVFFLAFWWSLYKRVSMMLSVLIITLFKFSIVSSMFWVFFIFFVGSYYAGDKGVGKKYGV